MHSMRSRALTNVTSYSMCIAASAMGMPQRGTVHSVFNAAANIVFPGNFVLSLNALATTRMPKGLQLSSPPGRFPFWALRAGMPVIFGAQRLHIEAIDCSLDLSQSPQWNPHIQRSDQLDMTILQKNYTRIKTMAEEWDCALRGEGHSDSRGGGGGGRGLPHPPPPPPRFGAPFPEAENKTHHTPAPPSSCGGIRPPPPPG